MTTDEAINKVLIKEFKSHLKEFKELQSESKDQKIKELKAEVRELNAYINAFQQNHIITAQDKNHIITAEDIRSGNKEGNLYISAAEYVKMQDKVTSYRRSLKRITALIDEQLYDIYDIEQHSH